MTNIASRSSLGARQVDGIGVAAIVAITFTVYVAGVKPWRGARDAAAAQQVALEARQQEVTRTQQALHALQRQNEALSQALSEEPITLLPAQQSNHRLAELSRLLSDHGLQVHEVTTDLASTSAHFQLVPIHVSGNATFAQCASFLNDLSARFADLSADTIELVDNPSERDALLAFRFDLTWFAAPAVTSTGK